MNTPNLVQLLVCGDREPGALVHSDVKGVDYTWCNLLERGWQAHRHQINLRVGGHPWHLSKRRDGSENASSCSMDLDASQVPVSPLERCRLITRVVCGA